MFFPLYFPSLSFLYLVEISSNFIKLRYSGQHFESTSYLHALKTQSGQKIPEVPKIDLFQALPLAFEYHRRARYSQGLD